MYEEKSMKHKSTTQQTLNALIEQRDNLSLQEQQLRQTNLELVLQQHVLASCCDVLHLMRTGEVPGWSYRAAGVLQGELPLLLQLGVTPDSTMELQLQRLKVCCVALESHQDIPCPEPAASSPHEAAKSGGGAAAPQPLDLQQQQQQLKQQQLGQQQGGMQLQQVAAAQVSQAASSPGSQDIRSIARPATASTAPTTTYSPKDSGQLSSPTGTTPPAALQAAAAVSQAAAAASDAASPVNEREVRVAVPADYMGAFRQLMTQPPVPGASSMTLQDFAQYYSGYVKEAALWLSLVQQRGPQFCTADSSSSSSTIRDPMSALAALMTYHGRVFASLMLLPGDDMLHKIRVLNCDSLDTQDAPEQAWERMCWLADNLQLRSDQQEAIIAGSRLFERLLDQVRAERCQLLEQQGEQVEQRFSPQSSGGLQLAQDTAKQLQVLLRKECFLVSAACMFTGGVMDLEQVARAAVLCWPYVPQLFMLGPGIMRRMQEGQQKAQDPGSAAPTAE